MLRLRFRLFEARTRQHGLKLGQRSHWQNDHDVGLSSSFESECGIAARIRAHHKGGGLNNRNLDSMFLRHKLNLPELPYRSSATPAELWPQNMSRGQQRGAGDRIGKKQTEWTMRSGPVSARRRALCRQSPTWSF
ncbi:hypothetical protein BOSEA31B_20451 [Hyphomicrobiales bacterium]|nr:hypothetical protein BOSEA31B_20451 [Hyphomicrobiales bacterium]CAH1702174.1 hypothetical protein BOSEA1005_30046 [Hyphomicrobiales bacterium]CAI0346378.1 hypothetical protein BO1005MUT1_510019 [Hyphomicrobiales bacterium]